MARKKAAKKKSRKKAKKASKKKATKAPSRNIAALTHQTPKKKIAFLEAFRENGSVKHSAEIAGISRITHYDWLKKDEKYATDFINAREDAADALEKEARRRAKDGVLEPVFYQGEKVATVRKYSDVLLIFLLKGNRPEKFKERYEHTGKGGGPIEHVTIYIPENNREETS